MDFSSVRAALDSKSYDKVADVCDNLMLQVAADGIAYQDDWPYAIHLLSHIYVHDIIYVELYAKEMFQLLLSAYSMISIKDTALFLGMNEDDATNYVLQQGWTVDPTSRMLIVKKQPVVTQQKLDPSKLQRLTECLPS
ncbi:COP9 signalosome complex subunit 8 [Glycine soja]|uniref:COP9 signalosome complex subunit 8 n=1 Tax=Glycine soja TaxID=3848 RepID=A0A0B2NXM0_GLYSO|nr:COP9 signalosome complex subunit 8 [Glycine soja]